MRVFKTACQIRPSSRVEQGVEEVKELTRKQEEGCQNWLGSGWARATAPALQCCK